MSFALRRPAGERVVALQTDTDDFVYAELLLRALVEECAADGVPVEIATAMRPDARLESELGPRAPAFPSFEGRRHPVCATGTEAIAAIDPSPARALVLHLRGEELLALDATRPDGDGPWIVWDRHVETDLNRSPAHWERMAEIASRRHVEVFTFRSPSHANADFVQKARLPPSRVHLARWSLPLWLVAPRLRADRARLRVFTGGDTARDYDLLREALRGLPVDVGCVTSRPLASPGDWAVTPRLPLHRFRDAIAMADVVAIPLAQKGLYGTGVQVLGMGLGKPVVVSDHEAARRYAEPGREALMPAFGDVRAMREAVESLVADPAGRLAMGSAASARMRRDMDVAMLARAMIHRALA
jgi:hypothetical protein